MQNPHKITWFKLEGDWYIWGMKTRAACIFILTELKKENAHISPIDSWKFQEDHAFKVISGEDFSIAYSLVLAKDFVKLHHPDPKKLFFLIQLMPKGIEEIDNYYDEIKKDELENKIWNPQFKRSIITTCLGVVLGATISQVTKSPEKPIQVFPIIPQKIQIVHDTFYIASPKKFQDTSLVRLVKAMSKPTNH